MDESPDGVWLVELTALSAPDRLAEKVQLALCVREQPGRTALDLSPLEQAESLEQLRALEHGFRIRTVENTYDSIGVDTPADLERVRRLVAPRLPH